MFQCCGAQARFETFEPLNLETFSSSIEQILPPLIVRPAHQSHDVTAGMQIERVWLAQQFHAGFGGMMIALAAIAEMAARNQVLPG